jgi:hypothetical protein
MDAETLGLQPIASPDQRWIVMLQRAKDRASAGKKINRISALFERRTTAPRKSAAVSPRKIA